MKYQHTHNQPVPPPFWVIGAILAAVLLFTVCDFVFGAETVTDFLVETWMSLV